MAATIDYSKTDRSPQMIQEAKANQNGWVYVIEGDTAQMMPWNLKQSQVHGKLTQMV